VYDTFTTQKRELCGPFGLVITLGPPTESISKLGFLRFQHFWGFVSLEKKRRRKSVLLQLAYKM
jgi:hypothetical protein